MVNDPTNFERVATLRYKIVRRLSILTHGVALRSSRDRRRGCYTCITVNGIIT